MTDFLHEKTMLALNKELGFNNNVFLSSDDDSEYSSLVGKKARQRRAVKKDLRGQGLSRKEARKEAMVQVGRGKLGKGVLKVSLAPMRGAFLSLLLLNFRGIATKIMAVERNQPELKKRLKSQWENQFGGSYDELIKAAQKAENKKPFFCGKQCKLKVVEQTKSSFNGVSDFGVEGTIYDDFSYTDPVLIGGLVSLAGTVVAAIGSTVNQAQVNKGKKMEIEAAERMAEKELATLTANQKAQIDAAERRLQAEADPKKAILNNPDLSTEEKKSAIELLEKTETSESSRSINRVLMIGIPVLLVVGLGFYFVTRKK